jgi:Uma2 family endonuclease
MIGEEVILKPGGRAMTTILKSTPDLTPPPFPVKRFSVDEYHRMIDAGVFVDDDRFELLEGWIIPKPMTRNPPHEVAIAVIQALLMRLLPAGSHLRTQSAITTRDSEPEPDIAVIRGEARDYLGRHPGPADLALVIEVSDSTLPEDRTLKARLYARAGIPTYWIVNVAEGQIEVHADPSGPASQPSYRERSVVGPEGDVALVIDGREVARVAARDLLP